MSVRRSSLLAFGLSLLCTFTTAGAVDPDPSHLAVPGDFNGDGRLDVLWQPLASGGNGALVLQDGTGQLTVMAQGWEPGYLGLDWSTGASTLTAADLNGDGQDDVLIQPVKAGGTAAVIITDPSVQLLQLGQLLPAGYLGLDWSSATHVVTAGDFDGDHHKELLLQAAKRKGAGAIVHADAEGRLGAVIQSLTDGYLGRHWNAQDENLYVGDFNGDGRQDLLVQSRGAVPGESVYALLLADGDGRFTSLAETWNNHDLGADWTPATHKLSVQTLDGVTSVVLQSTTGGTNYVFQAGAQGSFTQPTAHWTGNKSAADALNTQGKTGIKPGTGIAVTFSPTGPSARTITAPSNPEQNQTGQRSGQGVAGSGQIMTVNAAGTLAGSGGVSGGTATYSIPIAVPPGIAGMQPSVSLNYSSKGGNGEMGMGWSVSAASQIHRCPATQAMDGYSSGVTYTYKNNDTAQASNDRLCLDGQHLILVSGTYGQTGAVYRTELDGFSKITQNSTLTDTANSFTVVTKSGNTLGYGASSGFSGSNAVFTPSGAPAPLAWGLAVERDPFNNSVIYYYSSFGAGEYLLTSIKYTGTGATAGNREVDFSYGTRADVSSQYLAGGSTMQTQLLSSITTKVSGQVVRTYSTDYLASAATTRTLLNGVQECAGSGTAQQCLPETTFTWHAPVTQFNAPVQLDPDFTSNQDNGFTLSAIPAGDFDGDGRKDLIFSALPLQVMVYFVNADGSKRASADITTTVGGSAGPLDATADLNNDGAADLLGWGTYNGAPSFAYSSYKNGAFQTPAQPLPIPSTYTVHGQTVPSYVAAVDVDGDGRADIVTIAADPLHSGSHMVAVYLNQTTPCATQRATCWRNAAFSSTPIPLFSVPDYTDPTGQVHVLTAKLAGDVDGNGLPDFEISYYDTSGAAHNGWVYTQEDSNGNLVPRLPFQDKTDPRLGIAPLSLVSDTSPHMMDINGDGLPDIVYDCDLSNHDWCYQLNKGGTFAPWVDTGKYDGETIVLIADIDNDGRQEFLAPGTMLADYCVLEGNYTSPDTGTKGPDWTCADQTDSDYWVPQLSPSQDHSIYEYGSYKFVPQADSTVPDGTGYRLVPQYTDLHIVGQRGLAQVIDPQGDGLTAMVSPFSTGGSKSVKFVKKTQNIFFGLGISSNSMSSATSVDAAPDLMLSSTDGFNHQDQWDYYPLSSPISFNAVNLYYSPASNGGYAGDDYFYFSSSMYVVGEYRASNGAGGMNGHDFHYAQAIYNSQGRGFQGFRTVVDDDNESGARTVQVYHQRFPLSGTLAESWVTSQADGLDLTAADPVFPVTAPGAGGHAISHVVNTWSCMQGSQAQMTVQETAAISCERGKLDASTYVPVLQESLETQFDVNSHDQLSQTDTNYCLPSGLACTGSTKTRGYDMYGNGLGSVSVTTDPSHTYTYTSSVTDTYDPTPDLVNWWVNKLKEKVTSVQVIYGPTTQPTMTRTTDYDYYTDGDRMPNHVYAHADGNAANELDTHYVYLGGNVTSVTVSGGTGTIGTGTKIAQRVTLSDYTASGGYFPNVVTDPAGLVTTSTFDPNTGEPLTVAAPDGVTTTNTYDGFGRKASAQVGSLPAQVIQYITHVSHDGMCDNTSAFVPYYTLVNQAGYPGRYTCYDSLNRAVRSVIESFATQSENVYVGTNYDAHGHITGVTEPHFSSQADIWNNKHYDYSNILGRMDYQTDAKGVKTAYAYSDLVTTITTTTPTDPLDTRPGAKYQRDDVETKNILGKLVSITNLVNDVDPNTGASAPGSTTTYQYDSDGNPVTITAADGNAITAVYDVLGHKTDVTDPDQGHTGYTYDVLGELLSQTDANAQTQSMTYDLDGRMLTKSSSVASEDAATWVYDSCTNGAGKLCSVTQTNTVTGVTDYKESYTYDGLGRVSRDEETIAGTAYDTDTSYDADGRVDTVTYPSSVMDVGPQASAGTTQYVAPAVSVTLDASGSTDGDNGPQPLAFQWSQTAGPSVSLSSATAVSPTFTTGGSIGTTYTFQVTADDGLLAGTASVNIVVPGAPAAPAHLTDTGDTNHDGTYTVSWDAVSVTGTSIVYHLEEAGGTASGPTQPYTEITPVAGISAINFPANHPDNRYYYYWYRVKAEDKVNGKTVGYSVYSATDSIHVVVTPGEPSSISPNNGTTTTGNYNVTWAPNNGALPAADVYYQLFESTSSTLAGASMIYSGSASSDSISQTSLGDYYYEVRACNTNGGVTECSAFKLKAHEIVNGTTGNCKIVVCQPQSPIRPGIKAPAPTTGSGPTAALTAPVQALPGEDGDSSEHTSDMFARTNGQAGSLPRAAAEAGSAGRELAAAASQHPTVTVRPNFAPPVYQAWDGAHLVNASGTAVPVRFAVKHIYTANGYLWMLADAVDTNRVYWHLNEFAGGSGSTDAAGNFYEHGMDARGNPTDVYLGGGAVMTHYGYDPNTGYLASISSKTQDSSTVYQSQAYQWYAIGNLYTRTSNPTTDNANTLTETFGYDLYNRVLSSTVKINTVGQTPVSQTYDSVGDISSKSDVGAYVYTGGVGGPHAVKSAGSNSYAYDADGNMTNRSGTNLDWNSDNLPICIDSGGGHCTTGTNSAFSYAPDKHRYKQVAMAAGASQTTLYVGGMVITPVNGATHYQITLSAYGRSVYLEDMSNGTTSPAEARSVLLTDHLGSVETTVDVTSGARGHQSYGAFGCHRDPSTWQCQSGGSTPTDNQHGYTDHEDLGALGLVHMNGRVYDPVVGRFLSVDPLAQAPTNSQSVNPYSYVMNNPLSLVDPSGYASCSSQVSTDGTTGGTTTTTTCDTTSTDIGSHIDHHGTTTSTTTTEANGNKVTTMSGNGFHLGETAEVSLDNGAQHGQGSLTPSASNTGGSASQGSPAQRSDTALSASPADSQTTPDQADAEAAKVKDKIGSLPGETDRADISVKWDTRGGTMQIGARMYFAEGDKDQQNAVISSIRTAWSGQIGNFKLSTTLVTDLGYHPGDVIAAIDPIMTRSVAQQGGAWMFLDPRNLGSAGHEFGHILHLSDGYGPVFKNGVEHDYIKPWTDPRSIMYRANGVVTPQDLYNVQQSYPQN